MTRHSDPADDRSAAVDEDYRTLWRSLPRGQRGRLSSNASRGLQGRTPRDAALTLWWADRQLRRGPWPALGVAAAVVVVLLLLQVVAFGVALTDPASAARSPIVPIVLLIPVASWSIRRARFTDAARLNAGVLAGRKLAEAPDRQEAHRLLDRARGKSWFREPDSDS